MMKNCPWDFLNDGRRHIVSLVGGGGKTTVMYELAAFFAARGRRTLAMTTTHIWLPQGGVYAGSWEQLQSLWQRGSYAVIGTEEPGSGKLTLPEQPLLRQALAAAEIVLAEADGARQLPCKVPAAHEPVLLPESDIVVAAAGMDALGKTLDECCFRWRLGREIFAGECNMLMDESRLAALLANESGARRHVGQREYYIVLNKCELARPEQLERLRCLLLQYGISGERIWLRSGVHK